MAKPKKPAPTLRGHLGGGFYLDPTTILLRRSDALRRAVRRGYKTQIAGKLSTLEKSVKAYYGQTSNEATRVITELTRRAGYGVVVEQRVSPRRQREAQRVWRKHDRLQVRRAKRGPPARAGGPSGWV
jgi:hypothetical protein